MTLFGFILIVIFAALIGGAVGYGIARKKHYEPDKKDPRFNSEYKKEMNKRH